MSKHITDFTKDEFLAFIHKIYNADYPSDLEHIEAVHLFERLSEHPSKSDLIYYPESGKYGPDAIIEEVQVWRAANGKPGFKTD